MRAILLNLPTTVNSFVYHNADGDTIVINARLSFDKQRECYKHELRHIQNNDFFKEDADVIERTAHEKSSNLHEGIV